MTLENEILKEAVEYAAEIVEMARSGVHELLHWS